MNEKPGTLHILVVEDEPKISDLLHDYLQHAGFTVSQLFTGGGLAEWVQQHAPALVLLDVMLPEQDGLEGLKQIRALPAPHGDTPVVMLTARVEEIDRLLGLELGADDYICKPFSPREVIARVKAVLRRAHVLSGETEEEAATLNLDEARLSMKANGCSVSLTKVECEMLKPMLNKPGQIFSREQLMQHAYDDHRIVSDRTIDSHIVKLRKKLAIVLPDHEAIESVYAVGYRYIQS